MVLNYILRFLNQDPNAAVSITPLLKLTNALNINQHILASLGVAAAQPDPFMIQLGAYMIEPSSQILFSFILCLLPLLLYWVKFLIINKKKISRKIFFIVLPSLVVLIGLGLLYGAMNSLLVGFITSILLSLILMLIWIIKGFLPKIPE